MGALAFFHDQLVDAGTGGMTLEPAGLFVEAPQRAELLVASKLRLRDGGVRRRDVYVQQQREQPRRIHHLKLRVMNPSKIAAFYRDSFDLTEAWLVANGF